MTRLIASLVLCLSAAGCMEAEAPPTSPASQRRAAHNDIPEPYRYGFVNAAIECTPDWGNEPAHVLLFLSDVFGFCPTDARDPRRLLNSRIDARSHIECSGETRVLYDTVDSRETREAASVARDAVWYQAESLGREVVDLDFASALPTSTCEPAVDPVKQATLGADTALRP